MLPLVLLLTSCDTDCNDCGPENSKSYELRSNTAEDMMFVFYRDFESGTITDSVFIDGNQKVTLFGILGFTASSDSELDLPPYDSYDSVKIRKSSLEYKIYYKDSCGYNINNPLCEENYLLEEEGKTNSGGSFSRYVLNFME